MSALVMALAVFGAVLGAGLGIMGWVPRMVSGAISIVASIVVFLMFWNVLGLPSVELADSILAMDWLFGMALGYIAGERASALL